MVLCFFMFPGAFNYTVNTYLGNAVGEGNNVINSKWIIEIMQKFG